MRLPRLPDWKAADWKIADWKTADWKTADWKTAVGYLLMIAALALSLPGVRVVRAEDEVAVISVNLVDSEAVCDPNAKPGVTRSAKVYLGSDPDPSDQPDQPDSIVLNNAGYSYQTPAVDPDARRLEKH